MNYWVYKCNARGGSHQVVWGDWNDFFSNARSQPWGSTEWTSAIAAAQPGDLILAYQTNRNELVGIAEVDGFRRRNGQTELMLRPVEEIRVKVRPLKERNPAVAGIPALQPGPIKTLYAMSAADTAALLAAAGSSHNLTAAPARSDDSESLRAGGGFGSPEENREVEQIAMAFVRTKYERSGWRVRDCSSEACGFDLDCSKGVSRAHVEVKGTGGGDGRFILTRNERDVWERDAHYRLALVTNVFGTPRVTEYRGARGLSAIEMVPLAFMCTSPL